MSLRSSLLHFPVLFCVATTAFSQNYIDRYLTDPLVFTTIAGSAEGVNQPRDLDFKPHTRELWIVNYGNSNGGSNVIVYNAGTPSQQSEVRQDSHNSHFMIFPSAIAFSDIGEWANTNEIKNTANPESTFMGPALWSADTNIHARVFQNNWAGGYPLGSHLHMLHQSPFSMGIAHDSLKVYWVSDGWHGNVCRYDFNIDHGPGYDDHSAGMIWRYTDVPVSRLPGVPGHMALDRTNHWLYTVDAGNKKVFRLNTLGGAIAGNLIAPNEYLASYKAVTGAQQQVVDQYTSQPCGIDVYGDRLLVGDYSTGEIRIYNTAAATPSLMGTIATGEPGMMGIKAGPDGKIWFVNYSLNKVVRIDPSPATNDAAITAIVQPAVINAEAGYHHPGFNICVGAVAPAVRIRNNGTADLHSVEISYSVDGASPVTTQWTGTLAAGAETNVNLPSSLTGNGEHKLLVAISQPNGVADENPANDTYGGSFRSRSEVITPPMLEDFSTAQFPPANWSYMGFNKFHQMSRIGTVSAYGIGTGALKMDNTNGTVDISGQTDFLLSPLIDLKGSGSGTRLTFDVAYCQYSGSTHDKLEIFGSTDCGVTWNRIYDKAGSALSSRAPQTAPFTPEPWEWRPDSANIGQFYGTELLLLFKTTSNYGNNLYLDNFSINMDPISVSEITQSQLRLYPNPAQDVLTVECGDRASAKISIYNMLGVEVAHSMKVEGSQNVVIDISGLSPGAYLTMMHSDRGTRIARFIVQR